MEAGSLMVAALKKKEEEEGRQREVVPPGPAGARLVPGCWYAGSWTSSKHTSGVTECFHVTWL